MVMNWQAEVEQTVTAMGYVLVEIERATHGLLRVFIEYPQSSQAITVDDCEKVTRQLQYLLEVRQVDYQRLEVSSVGLDRPLKREEDYLRFTGERVEITFNEAVEWSVKENGKPHKQKRFIGRLEQGPSGGWLLEVEVASAQSKTAMKKKKTQVEPVVGLAFQLHEVKEAHLAPIVDFKKKKNLGVSQSDDDLDQNYTGDKQDHNLNNGDSDR